MTPNHYVLLDRDGVINHDSDDYIKSPEEWHPIEGSLEGIALLNRFNYKVVVITNQASLTRGLFDEKTLEKIHAKMRSMAAEKGGKIEAIYYCPHSPEDNCDCRKPKPGLLQSFADDNKVELKDLFFIGDSLRDIQAAQAAGANPILVKTGNGKKTLRENPDLEVPIFENLFEAAKYITSLK
jgi:D-glycero-D-manno-heptose 1,7-bisphosphate phosphatase